MEIGNSTKLSAVRYAVKESGVKVMDDVRVEALGITIPMYLPKFNISVFCGEDDGVYGKVKRYTHPVFIREGDTIAFVLEKILNTMSAPKKSIYRSREEQFKSMMTLPSPSTDSSSSSEKRKRKRITANAVKVTNSGKP